mmetsp:Transcript_24595/g.24190  ORF Transcript_24595/g.24190 Transcript_24595/m.24190 type:complete len:125 (-) Transcript_24595:120-494(-)
MRWQTGNLKRLVPFLISRLAIARFAIPFCQENQIYIFCALACLSLHEGIKFAFQFLEVMRYNQNKLFYLLQMLRYKVITIFYVMAVLSEIMIIFGCQQTIYSDEIGNPMTISILSFTMKPKMLF